MKKIQKIEATFSNYYSIFFKKWNRIFVSGWRKLSFCIPIFANSHFIAKKLSNFSKHPKFGRIPILADFASFLSVFSNNLKQLEVGAKLGCNVQTFKFFLLLFVACTEIFSFRVFFKTNVSGCNNNGFLCSAERWSVLCSENATIWSVCSFSLSYFPFSVVSELQIFIELPISVFSAKLVSELQNFSFSDPVLPISVFLCKKTTPDSHFPVFSQISSFLHNSRFPFYQIPILPRKNTQPKQYQIPILSNSHFIKSVL